MTLIIGYILAGCIGLSLGLIGGGGSILAVPILIYVVEVAPKAAIAMSLIIVGIVSLVGAIPHWLQGNVRLKNCCYLCSCCDAWSLSWCAFGCFALYYGDFSTDLFRYRYGSRQHTDDP